jgi:PAS domain S-box-containing protein
MDEGIVRSLAAPAYATNPAGYLVSYNDAAATLWGYRPELGKLRWCGSWKLFWSDSRPMDRDDCALALAFKAGPPTQPQTGIFERPDGFRLLYRAFPSVLRDAAGAIAGGLNILIETTERQASAIEMAKLASIIDGSNDAIISKSLDGIVLSWNQGAARIFGYSSEQMKGQSISRIIPQEFRAEEEMILATLRQGGIVEPFDTVRVAKDGHLVDVSLTVSPVYDGAGNVVGASKVAREISDKKRAEADAKTNEERFRLISLATNDAIWDLDLETGKLWWNEGLRDFFGYKDSDLESDANIWMARIHPDDRVRILRRRREMLRSGITNWSDEVRFNRVDGTVAIAVVRCFVIRGETGGATCLLGSISDVTERRAIDEQLRQSQKLEAVGQLTGGVAHDFNNLLTVILGNSEELAASLSGDLRLRSLAEMTATAAERGAELTRRLLAFARKQPLAPKAMDVNALLAGMDQLLRRTLSEAIEIDVIGHAGPWKAIIDPGQLESALLNLTLNARDAMPNGGRLIIATSNVSLDEQYARQTAEVIPGEYVLISISDTGSGMNEATIRRAFEPFFTTKDTGKGSGLGLSMVYGFIKQSMGHIKIYSETGFGTTVKLYLPRAASDDDVTVATSGDEAPMTGNESILVVEDDDLVRTYVSGLLDALGYKVTSAKNGPDARWLQRPPARRPGA